MDDSQRPGQVIEKKIVLAVFSGFSFSSCVSSVLHWNCWLLHLKRKKRGGQGHVWVKVCFHKWNNFDVFFFLSSLVRSVVSFVGTALIYPPPLSLSVCLSLVLSPTLSCISFSGSCQSLSFSYICSLPSLQLKVTVFSSSSACLWQKGTMGKAWLSLV